jgi:acetyl-CoA carboxylase/biotin carboxylase 1
MSFQYFFFLLFFVVQVVWIGPPPSAMRALGDKIGSTLIAQTAGVPCMPWSGDGLHVNYASEGIPDALYKKACVSNSAEALSVAERIGYPVMLKASEGGGGKGIRRVTNRDDIDLLFSQVQGEVPGSPIFLMKLAPTCRHLEVQLLADRFNDAIAIFGR